MSDQPSTNPVRFLSLARLDPRFQIYFLLAFNLFLLWMLYNFSLSKKTDLPIDGVGFLFFLLIWRWDIIGFWLAYLCLLLFFLIVGHVWGWPYICLFVAILSFIYLAIRIRHHIAIPFARRPFLYSPWRVFWTNELSRSVC